MIYKPNSVCVFVISLSPHIDFISQQLKLNRGSCENLLTLGFLRL